LLIGKSKQQTLGTARSTWLDLGEDGEYLRALSSTGRGHQSAHLDRSSCFLQRPRSCPAAGAGGGTPACNSDTPSQQTIGAKNVVHVNQRSLIGANWYRPRRASGASAWRLDLRRPRRAGAGGRTSGWSWTSGILGCAGTRGAGHHSRDHQDRGKNPSRPAM